MVKSVKRLSSTYSKIKFRSSSYNIHSMMKLQKKNLLSAMRRNFDLMILFLCLLHVLFPSCPVRSWMTTWCFCDFPTTRCRTACPHRWHLQDPCPSPGDQTPIDPSKPASVSLSVEHSRRHFSHGRAAAKRSRRAFNTWDLHPKKKRFETCEPRSLSSWH